MGRHTAIGMSVGPRAPLAERFWSRVQKGAGCWLWAGVLCRGYGRIVSNGKQVRAHRVSWELHFGPVPAALIVCHRCDNPRCVRPDHLFLGTHGDNVRDRVTKGRTRSGQTGEASWKAKLTADAVRAIRAAATRGASRGRLAAQYGVSRSVICEVVNRKAWRHVS